MLIFVLTVGFLFLSHSLAFAKNGIADDWFGIEPPKVEKVTASDYETAVQKGLNVPVTDWAKGAISKITSGMYADKYPTYLSRINPTDVAITNIADILYNQNMATAKSEADEQKQARIATLAEQGINNSTIVGDVTADIDKALTATSYKAKNDALNNSMSIKMYNDNLDYNEFVRQKSSEENTLANIVSLLGGQSGVQSNAMNAQTALNKQALASGTSAQNNFYGTLGQVFGLGK